MPVRLLCSVLSVFICYIFVRLFTIGHSFREDKPLTGCRRWIIDMLYKVISLLILFFGGMRTRKNKVDFDYTPYLGAQYMEKTAEPKYISTYVSNHSSWLDVPILIANLKTAFASKGSFKTTPIFGIIVQSLGCLFISRGGTAEEKE